MEFLAREVASLRMAIGEVATRDFLRSELRALLAELEDRADERDGRADDRASLRSRRPAPTRRIRHPRLDLLARHEPPPMSSRRTQIWAALATVNDPEIKRPITELGMVESIDDLRRRRRGRLTVLLTVSGCPLKDTITRDVTAAVGKVAGVTAVDLDPRRDDQPSSAPGSRQTLRGGQPSARSPSRSPAR